MSSFNLPDKLQDLSDGPKLLLELEPRCVATV